MQEQPYPWKRFRLISYENSNTYAKTHYIGLFLMNGKFKRKGIAAKIIGTLTDEVFREGYRSVRLSVQDNNISGFSFWKKLGFYVKGITDCTGFCNLSMEYNYN